jgi:hypothetical protein
MNSILSQFIGKFVSVYLDDILIYSKTPEEHLDHVRQVLDVLRRHRFYVRKDKCAFWKSELFYLGHIISAEGIRMDPAKVQAIRNYPQPTDQTQLRGFLGMTNYFSEQLQN